MATTSTKRHPRVSDQAMLDAVNSFPHTLKACSDWDSKENWDRHLKDIDAIENWCRQHGMTKKQWDAFRAELYNGNWLKQKALLTTLKIKAKANKSRQDAICSKCGRKLPTQKMLSSGFRWGKGK